METQGRESNTSEFRIEDILAGERAISDEQSMTEYILAHMPYIHVHIVASYNQGINQESNPVDAYFDAKKAISCANMLGSTTSMSGLFDDYAPITARFSELAQSEEFSDFFREGAIRHLYNRIDLARRE